MEEKNGRGIFLGVVGVATLVVAIIGATFAYFSASATNSGINGTTGQGGKLTLGVKKIDTDKTGGLIPLNVVIDDGSHEGPDHVSSQLAAALNGLCADSNQADVCDVYQIAVTNSGSTAVNIVGDLVLTNGGATHLRWDVITAATTTEVAALAANSFTATPSLVNGGTGGFSSTNKYFTGASFSSQTPSPLSAGDTQYYYVMVWLEETGESQDTPDAGKTYSGVVNVNATDTQGNVSGLTATFSA